MAEERIRLLYTSYMLHVNNILKKNSLFKKILSYHFYILQYWTTLHSTAHQLQYWTMQSSAYL